MWIRSPGVVGSRSTCPTRRQTRSWRSPRAHQGDYVALVLDGAILGTMPIDGRTRNGNFVFTGDYTEAETRLMASYLYQDPIRFDLQPTADIEVPSR